MATTTTDKYVALYRQTIDDLEAKVGEKADLEERLEQVRGEIVKLRQIATSLSSYRGLDPRTEYPDLFVDIQQLDHGITSTVRGCFKSGETLSAIQVRNALVAQKHDLTDYKNVLATIHTILKRLVKAGELFITTPEGGQVASTTIYMAPPADTIALAKKVSEVLKKKRSAWATYLKDYGGLILGDPPFFAGGRKLSPRQRREVAETLKELAPDS